MRLRILGPLGVGMAALVTAGTLAPGADAARPPHLVSAQTRQAQHRPPSTAATCYTQLGSDAPNYIISQNFEPELNMYDAQAADDFVLKKECRRPVLYIDGIYGDGSSPADSFNVTIYRTKKHGPGKIERHLEGVAYTQPCSGGWGCTEIVLRKNLQPGHWWLSVQANINYTHSGGQQWRWLTNLRVRHIAAMWQNPGDGFGTGCATYTDLISCVGADSGMGGDLSFSISSL